MFGKQSQLHSWMFIACIAALSKLSVIGRAPVPGEFIINEDISSPSQITASKKSSVWLHWNYTYGGDYLNAIMYSHQGITYKSRYGSTTIELARRKGQFSTIEKLSSIPDPIGTRIAVISDNSTLVVHNLQYNDSGSLFRSYVQVKNRLTALFLKPNVTLFVKGAPEFMLSPPPVVTASENSNFKMKVEMDGNPTPSATFQWLHEGNKVQTIKGTQLYPNVYLSTYALDNIPASYCGRLLAVKASNSLGTSARRSTNVTILPNLDALPTPQAGKPSAGCVRVKWKKVESGLCSVKYEVKFKDNTGSVRYINDGINIGEKKQCNIPTSVNISLVQLKISFGSVAKTFNIKVVEGPIPKKNGGQIGTSRGLSNKLYITIAVFGVFLFNAGF